MAYTKKEHEDIFGQAEVSMLHPELTIDQAGEDIGGIPFRDKPPKVWFFVLSLAMMLMGVLGISIGWLLYKGTGVWGLNIPVAWGCAIV